MVFSSPGVRVREQDRGALLPLISTHNAIYLFQTVTATFTGDFGQTYLVKSEDEFTDLFGTNGLDSVTLIFAQNPNSLLQVYPVEKRVRYSVEIPDPIVDETVYGLTVGSAVSVTADTGGGDTPQSITSDLITALNALEGVTAVLDDSSDRTINLSLATGLTATAESNVTLTSVNDGVSPIVNDYVDAFNAFALLPDIIPGFLICPEAFEAFTGNRTILINGLESIAVSLNCVGIIDGIDDPNINTVVSDRNLYGSPRGHLSYFAPWVKILDTDGSVYSHPPSPVVASIWAYYISTTGVKKSPLGTQKTITGITGLSQQYRNPDSEVANPNGVNLLQNVRRAGNVIWGGRTISNNANYQFCTTRVIMNVINETCESAFDPFIGKALDIKGGIFHDLRNTGNGILFRLFAQGALYGNSAEEAYLVICDESNNPEEDLETGLVTIDLFAKPTPTLERVLVTTIKVPLTFDF